jgi:hypothetical protein
MSGGKGELLEPQTRTWMLALLAALSLLCYLFLVAVALNHGLKQVWMRRYSGSGAVVPAPARAEADEEAWPATAAGGLTLRSML